MFFSRNALPRLRHDDPQLPVDLSEADAAHEGAVGGEVVHHVRHVVVRRVRVLSPLTTTDCWDSNHVCLTGTFLKMQHSI